MKLSDLQLPAGTALVRRGKGGKGRSVPFGPQTTRALDRYIRARRTHRLAGTDALWLGDRGKEFSLLRATQDARQARAARWYCWLSSAPAAAYRGASLARRGRLRGRSDGGSRLDAPGHAGAATPRARASERAAEEARRLNLGEL